MHWTDKLLSLDSPRWLQLQHAYGAAGDIPALLRQLDTLPAAEGQQDPWFYTGPTGIEVRDIDVSKRRLVTGISDSERIGAGRFFGWVRIVEFAEDGASGDPTAPNAAER